jgi:hypothetical protein
MPTRFLHAELRKFTNIPVPALSEEAREAVNAALKAMSAWRNDIVEDAEKIGKRVIDKMAEAAAALGWPEQVVDAARTQMQSIADMQIATMDRVMDAWEEQLKSPNPTGASPSAMLSRLNAFPGFGAAGSGPGADAWQKAAQNPMQFWMQFAEQWQKSWSDMMTSWNKGGKSH